MLKKLPSYIFVLLGFIVLLASCKKDYETVQNIDDRKIEDYLSKNNVQAIKDPQGTGFYYQITSQGTGDFYKNTDSVRYSVTVKSLLNGTVFYTTPESSNLSTFVGYSSQLLGINIKAMLSTLTQLKAGGAARIILPSYLAFGKNGYETLKVPSNEILEVTVKTYLEKQHVLDDNHIKAFLIANKITNAVKDASGVYYVLTTAGTGTNPITLSSTLTTTYTGRFLDGAVFDSATDNASVLGSFIPGWAVLRNFKQGAVVRIIIPSILAYGSSGRRDSLGNLVIGGNACLDFDVSVTKVEN
ncbi:MAG: FKBP-type peptidyl-prolyl cis-trans isomerase [Bacteroidota bacterium]